MVCQSFLRYTAAVIILAVVWVVFIPLRIDNFLTALIPYVDVRYVEGRPLIVVLHHTLLDVARPNARTCRLDRP